MFCIRQKATRLAASAIAIAITIFTFVASVSAGTTYSAIHKTKWASCSACAGRNGTGPVAAYSQTILIKSPSLTGASTKFSIGGSKPYANALWWKQLGASGARNFKYDLYFYIKQPSAAQALEFDVNQSINGKKFIFGTECSIKSSGTWEVWSSQANRWKSTGVPCRAPSAYKWHHLVWQFQRTTGGNVKFVSVTLDGKTHYVNRLYAPKASGAKELNVAFQMDGNKYMTDYSVWLDRVRLTVW